MLRLLSKYKLVLVIGALTGLSQLTGLLPEGLDWLKYVLLVCSVLLAAYIKYTEVEPELSFEDKREFFFDYVCVNPMQRLRKFDDTARLNIMEVVGFGLDSAKSLNIIHDLHVEDDHPDKMMEMSYLQGVCGDAARKGELCYADISGPERPAFGLNTDQLRKTAHVTFVISMPIRKIETDARGKAYFTDEIVGVINIDSGQSNPETVYKSTMIIDENEENDFGSLLDLQIKALREIADYCSRVLS